MNSRALTTLLQYGIASDLATKAHSAGLTVTKARTLSQTDMIEKYGLSKQEAQLLSVSARRAPIDKEVVQMLLDRSNFACCACKGHKSPAYIIHHIVEY